MQPHSSIPYGFCHCGCGQKTPIAERSSKRNGWIKGQPHRFINGHNNFVGTPQERFWSKVKIATDHCWGWFGTINSSGYGVLFLSKHTKPRYVLAHRFSYELHNGPIPDNLKCLHRCDNPKCTNPKHLFLGTQTDNLKDMRTKERGTEPPHYLGSKNPQAILTEDQVKEIIRLYPRRSITRRQFALGYGISEGCLKSIIKRRTWKHIE